MRIVSLNLSTNKEFSAKHVQIVRALLAQLVDDFAPLHNFSPPEMFVGTNLDNLQDDDSPFLWTDSEDVPEALADHSVLTSGRPVFHVGINTILQYGGTISDQGPLTASGAGSHELGEGTIDPYCAEWVITPDGTRLLAKETGDPLQGDWYMKDGIAVQNLCGARYFNPYATGMQKDRYDILGLCKSPFELRPDGYQLVMPIGGDAVEVFGKIPEWKQKKVNSRTQKRIAYVRNVIESKSIEGD